MRLIFLFLLFSPAVFSHGVGHGSHEGFVSGFRHPFYGVDHVIAMVAVGIWGSFLGKREQWLLPVVFPLVMAIGAALGILKIGLPAVELGIALSGVVLGLLILFAAKPPIAFSAVVVAFFAIFHGYAHGVELHAKDEFMEYCAGFVMATGFLHLGGIGIGMLNEWKYGLYVTRACGFFIALLGGWYVIDLI